MANPIRPSKISDAVRPAVSTAKSSATQRVVSAPASASRPLRILITATSREDARVQARQIAAKSSSELELIDLAQVDSKYLRETEKRLLALMDTAEGTGAILFFDEADALFGKRSEVKDAHDRYANLETSYFLEQIENYPGTVIIATTQPAGLDPELLRKHAFTENRPRVMREE